MRRRKRRHSAPAEPAAPAGTRTWTPGTGLSSGGGSGGAVSLDVADFCCPEYLEQMDDAIQRNWDQNQGLVGSTTMKFTILNERHDRNSAGRDNRAASSHSIYAAQRALQLHELASASRAVPNPTLTVHLTIRFSAVITMTDTSASTCEHWCAARDGGRWRSSRGTGDHGSCPPGAAAVGGRTRDQRRARDAAALRRSRLRRAHARRRGDRARRSARCCGTTSTSSASST